MIIFRKRIENSPLEFFLLRKSSLAAHSPSPETSTVISVARLYYLPYSFSTRWEIPKIVFKQRFSYLNVLQNPLDGLRKHRMLGPTPRISDSVGLGQGLDSACLNSQVILMLQAPEQHFETHEHRGVQIYPPRHWGDAQLPWRTWLSGGEWNIWVSVSQKITCCLVSQ